MLNSRKQSLTEIKGTWASYKDTLIEIDTYGIWSAVKWLTKQNFDIKFCVAKLRRIFLSRRFDEKLVRLSWLMRVQNFLDTGQRFEVQMNVHELAFQSWNVFVPKISASNFSISVFTYLLQIGNGFYISPVMV